MNKTQRTLAEDIQIILLWAERAASYESCSMPRGERLALLDRIRPALEVLPDLLAACKAVAQVEDQQGIPAVANQGQAADGYTMLAQFRACVPQARAAIAKAGGAS